MRVAWEGAGNAGPAPSEVVTYRAVSNNATIFGDTTRDDSR